MNVKDLKTELSSFSDDQPVLIMFYNETGRIVYVDSLTVYQKGQFVIIGQDITNSHPPNRSE